MNWCPYVADAWRLYEIQARRLGLFNVAVWYQQRADGLERGLTGRLLDISCVHIEWDDYNELLR